MDLEKDGLSNESSKEKRNNKKTTAELMINLSEGLFSNFFNYLKQNEPNIKRISNILEPKNLKFKSINRMDGKNINISFEVDNIENLRQILLKNGLKRHNINRVRDGFMLTFYGSNLIVFIKPTK